MGRTIDAYKVIKDMQYYYDDCAQTSEYTRLGFETAMEVVKSAPTVEAIPKADYETQLKADMVGMLEDLDLQIDELGSYNREVAKVQRLIRDRIDKLKENKE